MKIYYKNGSVPWLNTKKGGFNFIGETINKLTAMNKDFQQFLKRVRIDLTSNEIRKEQYDAVEEEEELLKRIN